jgi:hypothetical protein
MNERYEWDWPPPRRGLNRQRSYRTYYTRYEEERGKPKTWWATPAGYRLSWIIFRVGITALKLLIGTICFLIIVVGTFILGALVRAML